MVNSKWRSIEAEELKRLPMSKVNAIVATLQLDKKEIEKIWPQERKAFEVF